MNWKINGNVLEGFGKYKGQELTWLILQRDEENGEMLVLSEKPVDKSVFGGCSRSYSSDSWYDTSTWDKSKARDWLNTAFWEEAFSKEERSRIVLSRVPDEKTGKNYPVGKTTWDRLFLLSLHEAEKYLPSAKERAAGNEWWLRTWHKKYDTEDSFVSIVKEDGNFFNMIGEKQLGIRPVLRISRYSSEERARNLENRRRELHERLQNLKDQNKTCFESVPAQDRADYSKWVQSLEKLKIDITKKIEAAASQYKRASSESGCIDLDFLVKQKERELSALGLFQFGGKKAKRKELEELEQMHSEEKQLVDAITGFQKNKLGPDYEQNTVKIRKTKCEIAQAAEKSSYLPLRGPLETYAKQLFEASDYDVYKPGGTDKKEEEIRKIGEKINDYEDQMYTAYRALYLYENSSGQSSLLVWKDKLVSLWDGLGEWGKDIKLDFAVK